MAYGGYITTSVDVHVDDVLDELDDQDLLDELEKRGLDMNTQFVDGDTMRELLTSVWLNRRLGKDFSKQLDDLIYYGLGKVI